MVCLGGHSNSAVSHYSDNSFTVLSLKITLLSRGLIRGKVSHYAVSKGAKPILPPFPTPFSFSLPTPLLMTADIN